MAPSEQLRRAKAEGLLTPLTGKTPEQKEKILEGLAKKGLPLPEGKTPSDKALIDKVRADLGLPKEPKNKAERAKHDQAAKAGLLQPLEGKTPAQKEKILKGLHDIGVPLPIGRTPSEKALIAKVAAGSRHPSRVSAVTLSPSEQMRRAKAEGLLTPLTGKTPEQKEKILQGLSKKGLPLPEGKTPSDKALIDKVRTDLGLPKEPKTKAERAKHDQAAKAGLLQPLEGKTPAQKEKILKGLHDMGIPLPEGRTPSEKALIAKVAAASRHPSRVSAVTMAPSEQLRRAKAEGLLTPLTGKSPEQKEKILKGLAMKGIPLPEGQTPSEKQLIDKVRANLGLPKEPKNNTERAKHDQAARAGLLQPLEDKTPAQKEKILKGLHNLGIPLPEGRTPSEKSLIAKVAASSRHPSKVSKVTLAPSQQLRKAKAEGLLTPLTGKTPDQKEKILKGLAMRGLPLPEGQTPSEKQLIGKVRAELGLPKEPKNKDERDKHDQAAKDGKLWPLEGRTPAQKEKVLKDLHGLGITLPEGRTPSEKSLIARIAAIRRPPSKVPSESLAPSEQLRRAKVEGLLTPLTGKTPDQKEKILKGLAMAGLPLPEGQTPSEKKLVDKVRADLGLPKEPKTKGERDKHEKAAKAGLLKPLEGKTPAQKEKILKGLHNLGIPLPEGRTPSEKSLIAKVAASSRHPSKVSKVTLAPSQQLRKAKAEGLLTPLTGKTPDQKEKILRGLAMRGLPLPEGQTPSEKQLIGKVRAELGLPKEPKNKAERDKHDQAAKDGKLWPLEGKTPAQKEKVLKDLLDLGITLPEGRTPSEKSLIARIAASRRPPTKVPSESLAPSEQLRRAKAEGLLTPLTGKTPEQKEKILKGLAMAGLPLPEGQTASEKKLVDKVRAELGLPKEPKTKAERDKHEKAAKAGLLKPLEGKTPAQKEKILKGLHDLGVPLPEGRTPSEKSLIAKIAAIPRPPSKVALESLGPSEQLRKAKAEGLLTPLTGKTPEQKEKILKGLAMAGLPLPEGQTASEKKLVDKVRADLGLPKEPKNKAEREKHEKAAKAGLLKPLEGKTPAQKEKILKGLHDLGITLPEGRTLSEKSLIAKVAAIARRASTVAVGMATAKIKSTEMDAEFQDVIKTTKCDRACGCDKKKIRFKHSYVKIRVTSPDISSFCDCPGECIPGVKSGAFIDNEGIKVTVGRVIGIPSFTISQTNHSYTQYGHKSLSFLQSNYSLSSSSSVESFSSRPCSTESGNIYVQDTFGRTSKSDRIVECLRRLQSFDDIYRGVTSEPKSVASSLDSVLVIKSEISLCSSSTGKSVDRFGSMSIVDSSISSNCTRYSVNHSTDDPLSSSLLDGLITSYDSMSQPATVRGRGTQRNLETVIPQREYTISRMSQTKFNFGNNVRTKMLNSKTEEPRIILNRLPNKLDISKIMHKIMANKRFACASSIFIVVPVSDDEEEQSFSSNLDSMTSSNASEISMIQKYSSHMSPDLALRKSSLTKRNEQVCGKGKKFNLQEISSSNNTETMFQNESLNILRCIDMTNDEICRIRKSNEIAQMLEEAVHAMGTDTTTDRPCCCRSKECSTPFVIQNCSSMDHYAANAVSKHKVPLAMQEKKAGCHRLPYLMRTSLESPDLPYNVPTRPSIASSQLPRGKYGRGRGETVLLTTSTESFIQQCGINKCSDVLVPLVDNETCTHKTRQSKMSKDRSSEDNYIYEDIEDAGILPGEILFKQSKMPENTFNEKVTKDACLVTGENRDRKYLQVNHQHKMPKGPACDPCKIIQESGNQHSSCQRSHKFQQEKQKPFSLKKKHDFQKQTGNNGSCVCQDIHAKRCCTTDTISKSKKNNKLTKFIYKIKKIITHKSGETSKIKKLSKKKQNSEEKPLKTECQHGIQRSPPYGWKDSEKLPGSLKIQQRIEKRAAGMELDFEAAVKYYVSENLEQFQDLIQPLESNQHECQERRGRAKHKKKRKKDKSNKKVKTIGNDNLKDLEKNLNAPVKKPCANPCEPQHIPCYNTNQVSPEAHAELVCLYSKSMELGVDGRDNDRRKPDNGMTGRGAVAVTVERDGVTKISAHDDIAQITSHDGVVESSGCDGACQTAGCDRVVQTVNPIGAAAW